MLPALAHGQVIVPNDTLYLTDEWVNDTLPKHKVAYVASISIITKVTIVNGVIQTSAQGFSILVEKTLAFITRKLKGNIYLYFDPSGTQITARYYINKYGYAIPL